MDIHTPEIISQKAKKLIDGNHFFIADLQPKVELYLKYYDYGLYRVYSAETQKYWVDFFNIDNDNLSNSRMSIPLTELILVNENNSHDLQKETN